MIYREILSLLLVGIVINSCGLNLNAPDDGTGGSDPDTTAKFQNVSSSNLPSGLSGTTQKGKAADFDRDGDLDLALAIPFAANKLLINDGSGNFADESTTRLPALDSNTRDLAVADFNSDGNPDLFFVGNQTANELYINEGQGNFSDLSNRIPVSGNFTSITALDIDGTGSVDVMIGNLGQNVMLINSGNAFFTDQTTQRLPQQTNNTRDIVFGDITGDNLRDMIIANDSGNRSLINTGSGFFVDQTPNRIPFTNSIEETRDVELVDVDNDGDNDIYFGNAGFESGSTPQDRLLINNGQGIFSDQTPDRLPAITTVTLDAEFADLDDDGDLDLIIGNYNGGISVLINDGSGFYSDQSTNWLPDEFLPLVTDLEIADLNNDGRVDLYISAREGNDQLLLQRSE